VENWKKGLVDQALSLSALGLGFQGLGFCRESWSIEPFFALGLGFVKNREELARQPTNE
jgi:hypothetical protein